MSKDQKQHYIPEFYQKQWAGSDGRLCEYCRRHKGVRARMCHPAGSGYMPGLYTISDVAPEIADHTEKVFLQSVDAGAAEALRRMCLPEPALWTSELKSDWIRFVMSLMHRSPERVAYLKRKVEAEYPKLLEEFRVNYSTRRQPGDPDTFEEFEAKMAPNPSGRASAVLLQMLMNSERVGEHIGGMRWHVLTLGNPPEPFLTSDRPVIMTNGLTGPDAHLALPLSPNHLFLAVNDDRVLRTVQAMDPREVLNNVNNKVCVQAKKYVYGKDSSQLPFVEPRLGQQLASTPLETRKD
jgi:hypothetical protein